MHVYIYVYTCIYACIYLYLKQLKDGLLSTDKCDLIAKDKLWCVYFGLIPRLA